MQNLANLAASAWRVIAIDQGGGKRRSVIDGFSEVQPGMQPEKLLKR